MKRSFTSLSVRDVLELAISLEDANAKRFEELSQFYRDRSPEASVIFWELSLEEREHGQKMRGHFKDRFGDIQPILNPETIQEVIEDPQNILAGNDFSDQMRPINAYRIAQRAEEMAIAFYQGAAETTKDAKLEKFYREFVEIEKEHLRLIRNRISTLYGTSKT